MPGGAATWIKHCRTGNDEDEEARSNASKSLLLYVWAYVPVVTCALCSTVSNTTFPLLHRAHEDKPHALLFAVSQSLVPCGACPAPIKCSPAYWIDPLLERVSCGPPTIWRRPKQPDATREQIPRCMVHGAWCKL